MLQIDYLMRGVLGWHDIIRVGWAGYLQGCPMAFITDMNLELQRAAEVFFVYLFVTTSGITHVAVLCRMGRYFSDTGISLIKCNEAIAQLQ